ncbi:hypothetical protein Plhal304r1_c002g0007861 [Plasmopara halstedii]
MQPTASTGHQADIAVADPSALLTSSSANSGLSSWPELKQLNAAVTVTPLESDTYIRNRKRQRPSDPTSPTAASFTTPEDLKLDFSGFEIGFNAASTVMSSTPLSFASTTSAVTYPLVSSCCSLAGSSDNVLVFLKALQLAQDSAALSVATQRLAQDGFDSLLALAFASVNDLQRAGIADAQFVWQQVHRHFQNRSFQTPVTLSPAYTVSRWLELCGIPKSHIYEYAEHLCRLGYSSVRDFEFIAHDQRALAVFKTGHSHLVVHSVQVAISQQQPIINHQYSTQGFNVYNAGSTSALLQPVDIIRENELDVQVYDSFLEALIEPTEAEKFQQESYTPHNALPLDRENDANYVNLNDSTDVFANHLGFSTMPSPVPSDMSLRQLQQEHLQLLYEAVNLPRPNPCRRGKKIYWSVLATGGTKIDRFTPLTQFTAAELQNAYLRQFEVPATNSMKIDAWSDENIRQLEHAVKDPRCRHLSKVCWEMLATGRTGVDDYAPLAKFTASQLRSRFRSLFGDKRPQKLRQKKQMQKLQHQQQKELSGSVTL